MMRSLLLAWMCMGVSSGLAAKDTLAPADILWSEQHARNPAAHEFADEVRARLDAKGPDAALALLQQADDPALQQFAAHAVLMRLGQQSPRDDAGALIAWAKSQPVRLWVQHDETAAAWYLPLIELSRTAESLEQAWQMQSQRMAWAERIKSAPQAALREIAAADVEAQQRAGEALSGLSDDALAEVTRLAVAQPEGLHARWWHGLAMAKPSLPAIEKLWLSGEAQMRLDAIRLAAQRLEWADASVLLARFEQDSELASASTLALIGLTLSPRGPVSDKQDALIIDRLTHAPTRSSAIAALARLAPVEREVVVGRLWESHADTATRSGLQQALRIAGDAAADRLLKRLADEENAQ